MKRVRLFVVVYLLLLLLPLSALAEYTAYVCNPNPADRLHLRAQPNAGSLSLGKYYNGTAVTVLSSNENGWLEVLVGDSNKALHGYMKEEYLSANKPADARPQYASVNSFHLYSSQSKTGKYKTFGPGELVSLLGFRDNCWHVMIHLENGKKATGFVFEDTCALVSLTSDKIKAYISIPDPADRLHLRKGATQYSESLGKYYNGTFCTLKGFSADGGWLKVNLYGRIGYMNRSFLTIEGKVNHTRYSIPEIRVKASDSVLYQHYPVYNCESTSLVQETRLAVLGLIGASWLHVQLDDGRTGYIQTHETTFSR